MTVADTLAGPLEDGTIAEEFVSTVAIAWAGLP